MKNKILSVVGYIDRVQILTNTQDFLIDNRVVDFTVTLIGGGGSKTILGNGLSGQLTKEALNAAFLPRKVHVIIGGPGSNGSSGEPSAFGDILVANGGMSGEANVNNKELSKGYLINNRYFGVGETDNQKASKGVCIIEYKEPIFG